MHVLGGSNAFVKEVFRKLGRGSGESLPFPQESRCLWGRSSDEGDDPAGEEDILRLWWLSIFLRKTSTLKEAPAGEEEAKGHFLTVFSTTADRPASKAAEGRMFVKKRKGMLGAEGVLAKRTRRERPREKKNRKKSAL